MYDRCYPVEGPAIGTIGYDGTINEWVFCRGTQWHMVRHSSTATTKTKTWSDVPLANVFLLNPAHQRVLNGQTHWLTTLRADSIKLAGLVVILVLFVLFFVGGLNERSQNTQLAESGVVVQGEVISRRQDAMNGRTFAAKYFVTYRFAPTDQAATYTREQLVSREMFTRLAQADHVMIRYLPINPTVSSLVGQEAGSSVGLTAYLMIVFGLIGAVIVLVFAGPELVRFLKNARLWRQGKLVVGHVLACRRYTTETSTSFRPSEYGSALKGNFYIELSYEFHSPQGKSIRATAQRNRIDLRQARLPNFGTPVAVLYLNDKDYQVL